MAALHFALDGFGVGVGVGVGVFFLSGPVVAVPEEMSSSSFNFFGDVFSPSNWLPQPDVLCSAQ